jgi:cytochrome c peroxidase
MQRLRLRSARALPVCLLATSLLLGLARHSSAQLPPPLEDAPVPRPTNLGAFVRDEATAIQLGKSLFWDEQLGSDGRTACASCHFHAGADSRTRNTIHPGADGRFQAAPLDGTITLSRFPIRSDDVVGSQGVVAREFHAILTGSADEDGSPLETVFGPLPQVTARNTPSVINAIFQQFSFWDGRAAGVFNGRTIDGSSGQTVLQALAGDNVRAVSVQLAFSTMASQAVGPPNSPVEMAWSGRTLPDLGKKMLALTPLARQSVHAEDSVLAALRNSAGNGLTTSYADLIGRAFNERWWRSAAIIDRAGVQIGRGTPVGPDQFSLMEANFSLFFGLAIQLYESTLISDDTPFDRFLKGDTSALSARQQLGMGLFFDRLNCDRCHGGAEFTVASFNVGRDRSALANIGVEPFAHDPGDGTGEFKTPSLRNVELTGPYFHNGQFATLRQVTTFYNRGGDNPNPELVPLGLSDAERLSLVDFLVSLTDERVRFERAPFDHPSLSPVNATPLPAVGAAGSTLPLQGFLGLSPFAGFPR